MWEKGRGGCWLSGHGHRGNRSEIHDTFLPGRPMGVARIRMKSPLTETPGLAESLSGKSVGKGWASNAQ